MLCESSQAPGVLPSLPFACQDPAQGAIMGPKAQSAQRGTGPAAAISAKAASATTRPSGPRPIARLRIFRQPGELTCLCLPAPQAPSRFKVLRPPPPSPACCRVPGCGMLFESSQAPSVRPALSFACEDAAQGAIMGPKAQIAQPGAPGTGPHAISVQGGGVTILPAGPAPNRSPSPAPEAPFPGKVTPGSPHPASGLRRKGKRGTLFENRGPAYPRLEPSGGPPVR